MSQSNLQKSIAQDPFWLQMLGKNSGAKRLLLYRLITSKHLAFCIWQWLLMGYSTKVFACSQGTGHDKCPASLQPPSAFQMGDWCIFMEGKWQKKQLNYSGLMLSVGTRVKVIKEIMQKTRMSFCLLTIILHLAFEPTCHVAFQKRLQIKLCTFGTA